MRQRTIRWFLMCGLTVAVSAAIQAAPPEGKGKPGGAGEDEVPAIVRLDDSLRITSDLLGDYAHADLSSAGGHVQFPGSGNLTMSTKGSRKQPTGREIVFDFLLDQGVDGAGKPLGLPAACDIQVDVDRRADFLARDPVFSVPAFMSLNRKDGAPQGIGLEGMLLNEQAPAGVGANFADPEDSKTTFLLRCGPGTDVDCGMPDALTVTCVAENSGGECVGWQTSLPAAPQGGAAFRCRLLQESRGNRYVIGDFDMPVGLSFFRDADEDGSPD